MHSEGTRETRTGKPEGRPSVGHISDADKIRITLARFEPCLKGQPWVPIATLAKRFVRKPSAISRAIVSAFKDRLVVLEKHEPIEVFRDESLERKIRDQYPGLHSVVVVSGEDPKKTRDSKKAEDQRKAEDPKDERSLADQAHIRMGRAMAALLAETPLLIRANDVIGIGSGRGVYYTVDALRRYAHFKAENVRIFSLTGALFPETHAEHLNLLLDADLHVALLASRFATSVLSRMASYPIAHENVEAVRRHTWLDKDEFGKHLPTHALVGVGVLEPGHRFYEAVKKSGTDSHGILAPILDQLIELVRLADQAAAAAPFYSPVADIANRLFFVPPPESVSAAVPEEEIIPIINDVNAHLLTIQDDQLQRIENLMLVAGTKRKALAIRHLLDRQELKVRMLCTDKDAAELILGE